MALTAGMGLVIGGIGILCTIITAPVVLGMEAAAMPCGLLCGAGKYVSRHLAIMAKNHDEIRVLAEAKLNTISDDVFTALLDGNIYDEEFRLILGEVEKYNQMKGQIHAAGKAAQSALEIDEVTKNEVT